MNRVYYDGSSNLDFDKGELKALSLAKRMILSAALAIVGISTASAAAFTNGSLTPSGSPTCTNGSSLALGYCSINAGDTTSLPGWNIQASGIDLVTSTLFTPPSGSSYSVDLNQSSAGGINQTFAVTGGMNYTVSYYYAGNPDGGAINRSAIVNVTGAATATQNLTFTAANSRTAMGWAMMNLNFTPAASGNVTLAFTGLNPEAYGITIAGVSVSGTSPAVPEPATLGVMGAGLLLVCLKKFRKA